MVWAVVNDTAGPMQVVWMPAHTAAHDVGVRVKSDGTLLTAVDRRANDLADKLAKAAAAGRRFQEEVRRRLREEADQVTEMAVWLARVTVHANRFPVGPRETVRDSLAAVRGTRSKNNAGWGQRGSCSGVRGTRSKKMVDVMVN